ncbi:neutral zinc metallopeptidase [Mycobacterium yunnanensis]|uniref:Neutral zinc metallopeptidase n=1 Tax=Mycobacterium yunnanensis TaxID=368477 RepID=A0A9X2YK21_9MYCO|nr:neutral zinc metallopeptidase [Mycobacterium yunnanensis]MCV7420747.1 neutral zinc metallopeptidase [Mycobacterium yunnanensis]
MGGLKAALIAAAVALLVAGCATTTAGVAVSPLYDPFRAGGLPAEDGPSGIRADAPAPEGDVTGTDGGDADKLATLGVNDVTEFWEKNYADSFDGSFSAITDLESFNSESPSSPEICGGQTYDNPNALFCPPDHLIAWDRGVLVPLGQQFFGDTSIAALLAHEYGHAVQDMAHIADDHTSTLVSEQQADCLAGTYVRWVAEGKSRRFQLSTGDGLNHVLAGVLTLRDPTYAADDAPYLEQGHGTALDRISAFQMGFTSGAAECGKIDMNEITQRRGDLPLTLPAQTGDEPISGDVTVTEDVLTSLVDVLGTVFKPANPPKLSFDTPQCSDAKPGPAASYCPASNTVYADVATLAEMGKPSDREDYTLLQGDDTALSVVTSRYVLAVEHERDTPLDTAAAALRTACLTGVAQSAMSEDKGLALSLTAGDLDEAVAGLLTNGMVASNVDGETVPAGFTRIVAFRSGLGGDADLCYNRFK